MSLASGQRSADLGEARYAFSPSERRPPRWTNMRSREGSTAESPLPVNGGNATPTSARLIYSRQTNAASEGSLTSRQEPPPPASARVQSTSSPSRKAVVKQHDLLKLAEGVARKAGEKYGKLTKAFQILEGNRSHGLTREQVRKFFDSHGGSYKNADRFFENLNTRKGSTVSYDAFVNTVSAAAAYPNDVEHQQNAFHGQHTKWVDAVVSQQYADEKHAPLDQKQMANIVKQMCGHNQRRFVDKYGALSRQDVQHIFESYGLGQEQGHHFFDSLDTNRNGEISFTELQKGLRGYLHVPEDKPPSTSRSTRKNDTAFQKSPARAGELDDKMMHMVCDHIGGKAGQKFRTVKDAFRGVETDFENRVDRSEVRNFFRNYGSKTKLADKFFDRMDPKRSGYIDFSEFKDCFAPYIQPGYHPPRPGEIQRGVGASEWGGNTGLTTRDNEKKHKTWGSVGSGRSNRSILSEDEIQMNKYGRFEGITTYQMSFNPDMYKRSVKSR